MILRPDGKLQGLFQCPAMFIFACIGILISLGIKAASRVNDLLVYVKMTVIFLFIICGIAFINSDNWVPFIPANTGRLRTVRDQRHPARRWGRLLRLFRL